MPLAKDGAKNCSTCTTAYAPPRKGFSRNRSTADGFQNVCKRCKATLNRNWKYALKHGELERMQQAQRHCCAICDKPSDDLVIDHDHKTGGLRALLCRPCNAILGMCDDRIAVLCRAIEYLTEWSQDKASTEGETIHG